MSRNHANGRNVIKNEKRLKEEPGCREDECICVGECATRRRGETDRAAGVAGRSVAHWAWRVREIVSEDILPEFFPFSPFTYMTGFARIAIGTGLDYRLSSHTSNRVGNNGCHSPNRIRKRFRNSQYGRYQEPICRLSFRCSKRKPISPKLPGSEPSVRIFPLRPGVKNRQDEFFTESTRGGERRGRWRWREIADFNRLRNAW